MFATGDALGGTFFGRKFLPKPPSKNLKQAVPIKADGHRLFKVLGEGF